MGEMVQSTLDLHRQLSSAGPEHKKTPIARCIEAEDRQIDRLVYELCGLTEEEIKQVETGGSCQERISPKWLNNIARNIHA